MNKFRMIALVSVTAAYWAALANAEEHQDSVVRVMTYNALPGLEEWLR